MLKLKLCTKCEVHHYENCPECFGFGYYRNKDNVYVPIPASKAEDYRNGEIPEYELQRCDYCFGSIFGNEM